MWISKSLVAVILGGGAGTRLYPLQPAGASLPCQLQENTGWWIFQFPIVLIQTLTGCLCLRNTILLR